MIQDVSKTYDIPKNGQKSKTKVFLQTKLQMDQKFRWYSMLKRLDQKKNLPNVMMDRIYDRPIMETAKYY